MTKDEAETVALSALAWLLADAELRPVFMGATGVTEADLRGRSDDPELLVCVLDFVTTDDAWVMRFATETGLSPEMPGAALRTLPGGASPHWT